MHNYHIIYRPITIENSFYNVSIHEFLSCILDTWSIVTIYIRKLTSNRAQILKQQLTFLVTLLTLKKKKRSQITVSCNLIIPSRFFAIDWNQTNFIYLIISILVWIRLLNKRIKMRRNQQCGSFKVKVKIT